MANLYLYNADGQAQKETQTFGTQAWELLVLSDWLVAQGVNRVAIASTGKHWPRVHRVLEHALTVQLSADVKDIERMVDLMARGLMQSHGAPPQSRRSRAHPYGPKRIALVAGLVAVVLTGYWLWKPFRNMSAQQLPVEPLSSMVRWQPSQVFYQQPGGTPFTLLLPQLERIPEGVPIDVTIEGMGDVLSWLQLDRERLHLHGTPPFTGDDQTYRLVVRAHTEQGNDSRLLVWLTIAGQPGRMTRTPQFPHHWAW